MGLLYQKVSALKFSSHNIIYIYIYIVQAGRSTQVSWTSLPLNFDRDGREKREREREAESDSDETILSNNLESHFLDFIVSFLQQFSTISYSLCVCLVVKNLNQMEREKRIKKERAKHHSRPETENRFNFLSFLPVSGHPNGSHFFCEFNILLTLDSFLSFRRDKLGSPTHTLSFGSSLSLLPVRVLYI